MVTTISSREFNQDVSAAKRAAETGPVVIMDRGRAAHVLLSYQDWQRLAGSTQTIGELLAMPEAAEVSLPLPARKDKARAARLR